MKVPGKGREKQAALPNLLCTIEFLRAKDTYLTMTEEAGNICQILKLKSLNSFKISVEENESL